MKKSILRFIIFSSAVLITKVVYDFIMYMLPIIKSTHNPYYDVLIGMLLQVILFLPLYNLIFSFSEKFMDYYLKMGKKTIKQEIIAIAGGYLVLLIIVFCLLLKLKFGISALEQLVKLVSR